MKVLRGVVLVFIVVVVVVVVVGSTVESVSTGLHVWVVWL